MFTARGLLSVLEHLGIPVVLADPEGYIHAAATEAPC
jgi:hypothetical protein